MKAYFTHTKPEGADAPRMRHHVDCPGDCGLHEGESVVTCTTCGAAFGPCLQWMSSEWSSDDFPVCDMCITASGSMREPRSTIT